MSTTEDRRPTAALLVLGLTWAIASCLTRALREEVEPLQQLGMQSWIAALVGAFYLIGSRSDLSLPEGSRVWLMLNIRAAVGGVGGIGLMYSAYKEAPVAHIIWIQAAPLTVIWGCLLLKEHLSWRTSGLLALCACGVAVTAWSPDTANSFGIGELKAVLGYILFSFGAVLSKPLAKELGVGRAMTWSFVMTALYASAAAIVLEGVPKNLAPQMAGLSLIAGLIAPLNSALMFYGYEHLAVSRVALLEKLQGVWTPLLALALFGEQPSMQGMLGGALIMSSAVGAALCKEPEPLEK